MADFTLNAPGTTDNPWVSTGSILPRPASTVSLPQGPSPPDDIWMGLPGGGSVMIPDWLLKRAKVGDSLIFKRNGSVDRWLLNGVEATP